MKNLEDAPWKGKLSKRVHFYEVYNNNSNLYSYKTILHRIKNA